MQTLRTTLEQDIKELISERGRISFADFMGICLYSPLEGFYSARSEEISAHFSTSPAYHPAFGALIARQLEQMWHILGNPSVFHLIEVGSGDGALAQSIVNACRRASPQFAKALYYVAADYQPGWPRSPQPPLERTNHAGHAPPISGPYQTPGVQRVKAQGIGAFKNVVGCILCNELIDNFPVHRFAIQDGRVKEVFVTLAGDEFTEILDEPSTPRIKERLTELGLSLAEGYRGEVCLALENWVRQLSVTLDRGFVMTIDYGELANDLYSPDKAQGTLVCYGAHTASEDPYHSLGQQDITCLVDFTSLMQLGERQGLSTLGYTMQSRFLDNLGFSTFLEAVQVRGLSAARTELERMALMALVDPEEFGSFKVLVQARGVGPGIRLRGFVEIW